MLGAGSRGSSAHSAGPTALPVPRTNEHGMTVPAGAEWHPRRDRDGNEHLAQYRTLAGEGSPAQGRRAGRGLRSTAVRPAPGCAAGPSEATAGPWDGGADTAGSPDPPQCGRSKVARLLPRSQRGGLQTSPPSGSPGSLTAARKPRPSRRPPSRRAPEPAGAPRPVPPQPALHAAHPDAARPCPACTKPPAAAPVPAPTCRATSAAAIAASPPQGPPRPRGRLRTRPPRRRAGGDRRTLSPAQPRVPRATAPSPRPTPPSLRPARSRRSRSRCPAPGGASLPFPPTTPARDGAARAAGGAAATVWRGARQGGRWRCRGAGSGVSGVIPRPAAPQPPGTR